MSSSYRLKKRYEQKDYDLSNFSLPGDSLGGIEDHYIRPFNDCHPDFEAFPIGHPAGVKVCKRRLVDGKRIDIPPTEEVKKQLEGINDYARFAVNIYDPYKLRPTPKYNPQYFHSRRIPYEGTLVRDDYLKAEIRYNATGLTPLRTPNPPIVDGIPRPWYENYLSFTPSDIPPLGNKGFNDGEWNTRTATSQNQAVPPYKYNVTRLHQVYPMWKEEQKLHGVPDSDLEKIDIKYETRII